MCIRDRYCGCVDYLQRGPVCKHVGAVLLTLASEQSEEVPQQEAAASSAEWTISPELRSRLERLESGERSAVGRGASERPATRAAGTTDSTPAAVGDQ
eukprot:15297919-Alexandrium_andersonii.AAC.1